MKCKEAGEGGNPVSYTHLEQIEKLRSGDDTKFLFEAQKQQKQQQNFKGFQPGASGEKKPGDGETVDFSKMSYDELTAYMEANPDAQI